LTPFFYSEAICKIPANFLNDMTYFISPALALNDGTLKAAFFERDALCINVIDPIGETMQTTRNGIVGNIPGVVRPLLDWKILKH